MVKKNKKQRYAFFCGWFGHEKSEAEALLYFEKHLKYYENVKRADNCVASKKKKNCVKKKNAKKKCKKKKILLRNDDCFLSTKHFKRFKFGKKFV